MKLLVTAQFHMWYFIGLMFSLLVFCTVLRTYSGHDDVHNTVFILTVIPHRQQSESLIPQTHPKPYTK